MRLDKYLKVSRIIKRRTVAAEACAAGKVSVNGKVAKPSHEMKIGDTVEITLGARKICAEVTDLSETVRKENAAQMYRILSEE
ncbi:MAG: RNA-binding S4 domain-containing protein [Clostridia bacterium]|nr:RNA-binding S4 domain-containing protein [Clostridia bacterium]